jgi:hypothetical protein
LAAIWPEVRTRQGIQNKAAYLTQAMAALFPRGVRDVPKYEWFAGDARQFRQSILIEIGRVATLYGTETARTARAMADKMSVRFSEADMTTSEIAAWLRGQRLQAQGRSRRGRDGHQGYSTPNSTSASYLSGECRLKGLVALPETLPGHSTPYRAGEHSSLMIRRTR